MRFVKTTLWDNVAKAAGDVTSEVDISKVEFIGVYVRVSAATDIALEVDTARGWVTYTTLSFSAAGENFWTSSCFPFGKIRFKTSAAATITVQVFEKT